MSLLQNRITIRTFVYIEQLNFVQNVKICVVTLKKNNIRYNIYSWTFHTRYSTYFTRNSTVPTCNSTILTRNSTFVTHISTFSAGNSDIT